MIITRSGRMQPFYRGTTTLHGKRLTFFSSSIHGLVVKQQAWLKAHQEAARKAPALRVAGGTEAAA